MVISLLNENNTNLLKKLFAANYCIFVFNQESSIELKVPLLKLNSLIAKLLTIYLPLVNLSVVILFGELSAQFDHR